MDFIKELTVTAEELNSVTDRLMKDAQAADSAMLEGNTLAEMLEQIPGGGVIPGIGLTVQDDEKLGLLLPTTPSAEVVAILFRGSLSEDTNLDSVRDHGFYRIIVPVVGSPVPTGTTANGAYLQCLTNSNTRVTQLFYHNTWGIFHRVLRNTTWSEWVSISNINLMHTWTSGEEIVLGSNLRGIRNSGTLTASNGTAAARIILSRRVRPILFGGYMHENANNRHSVPFSSGTATAPFLGKLDTTAGQTRFMSIVPADRVAQPYDVWLIYTDS
jgi:hypothetical protein